METVKQRFKLFMDEHFRFKQARLGTKLSKWNNREFNLF